MISVQTTWSTTPSRKRENGHNGKIISSHMQQNNKVKKKTKKPHDLIIFVNLYLSLNLKISWDRNVAFSSII